MRTETRGVSAPLGVVLLLAIVVVGISVVVVVGTTAVGDLRDEAGTRQAEKILTQLDSESAMVALGRTDSREVPLSDGTMSAYGLDPGAGWMNVTITNRTSGWTTSLVNQTLGAVVYENDGASLAYQGGGVWKQTPSGAVMVSPPEFHYRDATLTLPIIAMDGSSSLGSAVTVSEGNTTKTFPNPALDGNFTNPVENGRVEVTVHSEYYRAWGQYFERRTTGGVSYDHDSQQVTLVLLEFGAQRKVTDALQIYGGDGTLRIQSGKKSVIRSYNSTDLAPDLGPGSPPTVTGTDADVVTDHDLEWDGNAQVKGNVTTTGRVVDLSGTNEKSYYQIDGHLAYGQGSVSSSDCDDHVRKWCAKNASIDEAPDITSQVNDTMAELREDNDNADAPCLDEANGLTFGSAGCGSTVELGAGDYYLDQTLQVDGGQKLVVNTTRGDIRIAVDGDHSVLFQGGGGPDGANVTVVGNGTVRVYNDHRVSVRNSGTRVWNRGWDADQFWLLCGANCDVGVGNGDPVYVGVIYAPSNSTATGASITIENKAQVYGGIVGGGDADLKNQADIFFDTDLKTARVLARPSIPQVSYLHVTVNEITVSSD